ncbi:MAG: ankyrin repeat domain-containing protein, partial [Promethearchaeia archaeon]
MSRLHDSAQSEPWPRRQDTEARAGRSTSAAAIEPHVYRVMISADVMVFAVAVFLMAVMLVRILQRYDDRLYSRPHDQELQNLFKCHLQLAHVLEDELTRWLFTELDVVDPVEQGDQADRGSSSRTRADDAARQHNMPFSDVLNVALAVSSFLGLGNTAVFLLEQGALVNAPLKEPGVQLVQQLMRGLLWQRRLSGASLETGSVQATAFSSRSQTGIGEATPWSDVVDSKSHGQPLSQVPREEWHVDPDSQPQHATRSPLHKHEIKDRHLDGRLLLGATPLHMAAIAGHADIVAMLCQFGADVLVCNAAGLCPLDIVAPCAQDQCVCECNMVWGAGCRAQRTRAVLRQVARNVQRAARAGRLLDRIALLCPQRVLQVASALSAAWSGAVQAAGRQTSAASRGFGHSGIMSSLVYTMLATATFSVLALFPLETISFDWFHVSVDG